MKNKLEPNLRFPGFVDEWDCPSLKEIATPLVERVGVTKFETVSITAGKGFVTQKEKFSRDISGEQYKNYILLRYGDFAYNKGASKKFPQGCIYRLKEYQKVAAPNAFISFKFKSRVVAEFYQGYFDNNFHGKQLQKFITSGARMDGLLNINSDDFFSIVFPTPKQRIEQEKIAACLSSLDDLIIAENDKLETLKNHKKGLMQELFPADGEIVPKIRFPEFKDKGKWKAKKFEDVVNVIDGDRGLNYPKAEEFSESGHCIFLNAKNVTKQGFVFDKLQYITKTKDDAMRKGKLKSLDIILTTRGSVGQFAYYNSKVPFEHLRINSGMVIVRANSILPDFLYEYCKSELITSYVKNNAFGNAQQQLTVNLIKNLPIQYPLDEKEQQKIADCLSSLDTHILTQTQKIDGLKKHKKGLMQQLFPTIN